MMGKNVAESYVDYHVSVCIAVEGFFGSSKPMSKLWDAFSIFQRLKYLWFMFLMGQLFYFTWCRKFLNSMSYNFFVMRNFAKVRKHAYKKS